MAFNIAPHELKDYLAAGEFGIVIGGVVLVGVIVGLAVFFNKRRQKRA